MVHNAAADSLCGIEYMIEVFHRARGEDQRDEGQDWGNLKYKAYLFISLHRGGRKTKGKWYKTNLLRFPSLSSSFVANMYSR